MSLTGRKVRVRVGVPGTIGREWNEDLRIAFQVVKTKGKNPNPAKITIYNLSDDSIEFFSQEGLYLWLEAGDGTLSPMFEGDLRTRSVTSKITPPTRTTILEPKDGGRALTSAIFSQSYPDNTSPEQVLGDIAGSLGLPVAYRDPGLDLPLYSSGWAFLGRASDALQQVALDIGAVAMVQDGRIYITAQDTELPGTVEVISSDTGMKGSPEQGKKGIVKVKHTLTPSIGAGTTIKLETITPGLSGFYQVKKVTHTGDTRSNTWTSALEMRARSAAK